MHMHGPRHATIITCWIYSKQHKLCHPHNTKFPNDLTVVTNVVIYFAMLAHTIKLFFIHVAFAVVRSVTLNCPSVYVGLLKLKLFFHNLCEYMGHRLFFLLSSGLWRWISHIYEKGHLGGLLDLRSHGSAVSTACSNSLVSPSSCRTNREEEALKPHIATIRTALGAQGGRRSMQSQWGLRHRSEGVANKGSG